MGSGDRDHDSSKQAAGTPAGEQSTSPEGTDARVRAAMHRRWLQRKAREGGAQNEAKPEALHEAADKGLSTAQTGMPHKDKIQEAFGDHDVKGVKSAVGGAAAQANDELGSLAYASGDNVAFKNAPDLHTAAHEAAHIVQQRGGVSLSGGVGKQGDPYERHADQVADAVVAGKSAKPLLDKMAGKPASKSNTAVQRKEAPIQFLAGDVDNAKVGEQFRGHAAGKDTVGAAVGAKDQKTYGKDVRDANFNNTLKVDFENQLAVLILKNNSIYAPVLQKVSGKCMDFMREKAAQGKSTLQSQLKALGANMAGFGPEGAAANDVFLGRLASVSEGLDVTAQVEKILTKGGTVSQILFAHHQFMDNVWKQDYFNMKNAELAALAEKLSMSVVAPKSARFDAQSEAGGTKVDQAGGVFGESKVSKPGQGEAAGEQKTDAKVEKAEGGRDGRSRFNPGAQAAEGTQGPQNVAQFGSKPGAGGKGEDPPRTAQQSGISAREGQGQEGMSRDKLGQPAALGVSQADATVAYPGADKKDVAQGQGDTLTHQRGVDRVTMDEEQQFIQQARLVLDMPLAGAISGTTSDLMELGQMCKLGPDEQHMYSLGILGHLESAGAHSFHEIATAAANVGVPYTPGDYRSYLPKSFLQLAEVQALFKNEKYALVPGIGAPLDYQPAAAGGEPPPAAPGGGDDSDPKDKG